MRKLFIYLFFILFFTTSVKAQYLQLVENKGEIGLFAGQSSYNGDIAPNLQFFALSYGGFYKKQLNDYIGLRATYELHTLGGFDSLTAKTMNLYVHDRSLYFRTTYQDISLMMELYFLKFINGNKNFRCSPYMGFGIGYLSPMKDTSNFKDINGNTTYAPNIITMPLNLGFKYNITGSWNLFAEATYRFTNSDVLDHFGDTDSHSVGTINYQASTSGKDQYFSAKLGISYNLLKIYGPDKRPKLKRDNMFNKEPKSKNASKKGLFGLFNRK